MPLLRSAGLAVLSLALLAVCSKKPGELHTASDPPAAPASGPDRTTTAADLPRPRAGYWERVDTSANGARTSRRCESGKPLDVSRMSQGCSRFTYKRIFPSGVAIDSVCGQGGSSTTLHTTVSGDFNSSYASDTTIVLSQPGQPAQTITAHSQARYLGPCPAGQSPQD